VSRMAMQVRRYVISDYEGEYYFDYDSDDGEGSEEEEED